MQSSVWFVTVSQIETCACTFARTGGSTSKQSQGQSRLRPSVPSFVKSSSVLMSSSNLWSMLLRVRSRREPEEERAKNRCLSFPSSHRLYHPTSTPTSCPLPHSLLTSNPFDYKSDVYLRHAIKSVDFNFIVVGYTECNMFATIIRYKKPIDRQNNVFTPGVVKLPINKNN